MNDYGKIPSGLSVRKGVKGGMIDHKGGVWNRRACGAIAMLTELVPCCTYVRLVRSLWVEMRYRELVIGGVFVLMDGI